jgi:hypothetical protein
VRCLAAAPPKARRWRAGRAQLELNDRNLALGGLPESVRVAVFAGPGFASASVRAALKKVKETRPRVAMVLGGIGDEREKAKSTLRDLAELEIPVLVVAGGRDRWGDYRAAFEALEDEQKDRVIDITALRSIAVGSDIFVVVAGAANGRYARDGSACGFADSDLDSIAADLGPRNKARRWLLAWQVPAGNGPLAVGKTGRGVPIGDGALDRFSERISAPGGVFAWPDSQVMRPRAHRESLPLPFGVVSDDLRMVAPRLVGPDIERDDGTRASPGFALLVLTKAGMLVEEN